MHTPFKVLIRLGSPVCLTFPFLHFDSLIAHLDLIDKYGPKYFEFDRMVYNPQLVQELPLKKSGDIYHGSIAFFEPETSFKYVRIYKRFEDKYSTNLKKRKLSIGSGYFRSFAIAEPYIPAQYAIFYANGDVERVKYLLENYLHGLGNDIRIGWGSVRDIEIREIPEDKSLIKDGKAARVLPVRICKNYSQTAYLAYKPPYWHKRNVELCVIPGSECELNETCFSRVG